MHSMERLNWPSGTKDQRSIVACDNLSDSLASVVGAAKGSLPKQWESA